MAGLEPDREIPVALAEVERHEKIAHDYALQKKGTTSDATADKVDPLHEGLEVSDTIPWTVYMIAVVGLAERFSYYGATAVFVNFIQQPLPPNSTTGAGGLHGQSGALGRGQQMSTGLTTFYQFWSYVTPIAGAYVADTYWGRYKPFAQCLCRLFILSLIVTGMGAGGFKSNISPLVAEQYRRTKMFVSVTKTGERVSIYMVRLFLFFINIGALIGQVGMVYVEKFIGYWLAYTLPTIYCTSPPTGSVLVTAAVSGDLLCADDGVGILSRLQNLTADDFWESAKPSKVVGEKPAWMKFDDNWVEELRRGFKACLVFSWFPIYWLSYNQLNNNLTSQAATMSTHGLPNDYPVSSLVIYGLRRLCQLYPALVRWRINFRPLQRIAWGFYTGAAAMVWAAVVQHYVYKTNPCGYHAGTCVDNNGNPLVSPLDVWIQSGSMEYAFTKAPRNMRSLVMSMLLFTNAVASAIGEAFVSLSTDPLLVWNYGSIAVICGVSGVIFWVLVRKLNSEEDKLNNMAEGRFD
ncbi:hypothetical protein BKA82DRAFT_4177657 [Pisolithus tinctorius]|nr:hypothetical protein BKA82DRAFT_4177657 [Pisolithus tinctorius]